MAVPTAALKTAMSEALAADTASLGSAMALNVHLVTDNFTPGDATDFTALTEATFVGSTAKAVGVAPQTEGRDPTTGRRKIILKEPAGGWTWECTMTPALAETITGVVVTDMANAVTWGSMRLPTSVTVSALGDLVTVGEISFLQSANPLT